LAQAGAQLGQGRASQARSWPLARRQGCCAAARAVAAQELGYERKRNAKLVGHRLLLSPGLAGRHDTLA